MNQNDPVIMVSIEDTEWIDGTKTYHVFCWRHASDCFGLDAFTDENEAMRAALEVGVPVVRWMGWARRNEWVDRIEKGMKP